MPVSNEGALNIDKATQNLSNSGNGSTYEKPKSFIQAISEIQQYHVFEKEQEKDINANFFTLQQVFDFMSTGFKNGFIESLFFIILTAFFQTIYPSFKYFFLHESLSIEEKYIYILVSYIVPIIITVWLSSLYRLYDGTITRKAIISLFFGRSFAFVLKGMIIYYFCGYIYNIAVTDPERTYQFIYNTKNMIDWALPLEYTFNTNDIYSYTQQYIIPALSTAALQININMFIFAIVPFLAIFIKGTYLNIKRKGSEKDYEQY